MTLLCNVFTVKKCVNFPAGRCLPLDPSQLLMLLDVLICNTAVVANRSRVFSWWRRNWSDLAGNLQPRHSLHANREPAWLKNQCSFMR